MIVRSKRRYTILMAAFTLMALAPGHLAAQELTPVTGECVTSDPAECTVEPRSMESLLAISATNVQGTPLAAPPPMALATPGIQMPDGKPADEAVTASVYELVACRNAGDLRRAFAFYTDNVLIEFQTRDPLTEEERIAQFGATPEVLPAEAFISVRATEVRVLLDGTAIALSEWRGPVGVDTLAYQLVQEDGRYLIDGIYDAVQTPMGTPPA